jgi:uncharacterized protein (TIGR01777 family)
MSEARRVLVTGATGLVGRRLVAALRAERAGVCALTRSPASARLASGVEAAAWDGVHVPPARLAQCSAVVHLAGEPIFGGLPTARRRAAMRASRIDSTRALVAALAELPAAERPGVLVCASAVGYYGSRGEEVLTETAAPGTGFLAELCVDWEAAAAAATELGVRSVSLRIGLVLAREGGALASLVRVFRLGLGGRLGNGMQWMPWIHLDDLVAMIRSAIADERWQGPVNAVAPNPVRNEEWTQALAAALHRPALLPVPAFALRGALGEMAGELLGSRRVVPDRARALGFAFTAATLEQALEAELR